MDFIEDLRAAGAVANYRKSNSCGRADQKRDHTRHGPLDQRSCAVLWAGI